MKPPADLSTLITGPTGSRYRWDPASPDPQKQPLEIQIASESGKGCAEASVAINRPQAALYDDLKLLNEIEINLPDGRKVYDGRAKGIPVGDVWTFDADGWWSHGEQRKITPLIVDREAAQWGDIPNWRSAALLLGGFYPLSQPDQDSGALLFHLDRLAQAGTSGAMCEAHYNAPDDIGKVQMQAGSPNTIIAGSWRFTLRSSLTDGTDTVEDYSEPPGATELFEVVPTGKGHRHAYAFQRYNAAFTGDGNWTLRGTPTVYGETGLTFLTRTDGLTGFTASDGIKYLANKYAPKWDTSGVQDTTYPIPQAVWREPVYTTEAIQQLNGVHGWSLGVWPGRKLIFEPYDYTVADWQVRNGVDGVTVTTEGDTTENVFNGMAVTYTDFSGLQQRVTPEDSDDLKDTSDWIAANQWGDQAWAEIGTSWPMTQDDAVQIGRIALIEANRAKRPSTITVPMHIQDIHGSWHPSSLVRADQTVSVMNQHSPTPRLITRASWANHQLTLTTDNAIDTQAAYNARVSGALSAAGLV